MFRKDSVVAPARAVVSVTIRFWTVLTLRLNRELRLPGNGPVYLGGVDRNERQADQSREHHVHQQGDELLDIASYPLQLPQSFAAALILKQRVREIQRMSNAIGVDACANLLRDYID